MDKMIEVRNLHKIFRVVQRRSGLDGAVRNLFAPQFREVHAVNDITFSVEKGELIGYLGPNGAGKSTTIKMLTGLLVPTSGHIQVNGHIPWKDRTTYVSQIGAVFGWRTTLWWDLPVIDSLEVLQSLYNVPQERFRKNLSEFTELLDMSSFLGTPVRSLSLGQRTRADLCAALLHEPLLLFLDEPTIGLDVVAKERIREFIQYVHQQRHTTIILTTHDLTDVEKLCERIIIIDQGHKIYDGILSSLLEKFEDKRSLVVTFADDYPDIHIDGIPMPDRQGRIATYTFDARRFTTAEMVQNLLNRFQIADLEVKRPDISDTIRRIYEERLLHPN